MDRIARARRRLRRDRRSTLTAGGRRQRLAALVLAAAVWGMAVDAPARQGHRIAANGIGLQRIDAAMRGRLSGRSSEQALLELLPGLGPALSRRLVAAGRRTGHGIDGETLRLVPGISENRARRLAPWFVGSSNR